MKNLIRNVILKPTYSTFSSALLFGTALMCNASVAADKELPLGDLKLPAGFKVEVIARVPNARGMTISPEGTLYVGTKSDGKVYAVKFESGWKNAKVHAIAKGFDEPVGVALNKGDLYFSAVSKIYKISGVEKTLENPPKPTLVTDKFPDKSHHGWKFIAFGPDGKLYVPIGAPCNVCDEKDFSNIMRMNTDGTGIERFASGVRNTVGFDWSPKTSELWFTENGRDMMGDDIPGDELNHAPRAGLHFGFPYCHAGSVLDPEFGKEKKCDDYAKPAVTLGAHVAALGMRFYRGKTFPAKYSGQVFVAEHGSWNRRKKSGYRVMMATVKDNKINSYEPFLEGFLKNEKAWGRPVDVENAADGSLLVSDDEAGAIYRVFYEAAVAVR